MPSFPFNSTRLDRCLHCNKYDVESNRSHPVGHNKCYPSRWLSVRLTVLVCIFLIDSQLHADYRDAEAALRTLVDSKLAAAKVLNSVKDKPGAVDGLRKLNDLHAQLLRTEQLLRKIDGLSDDDRKRLAKDYAKQIEDADQRLDAEYDRLDRISELYRVLEENGLIKRIHNDRSEAANDRVFILTAAVKTYYDEFKKYPSKLEDLAKLPGEGNPFADAKTYIDPWGRSYQYDVKGPKNNGKLPDIWSLGARHQSDAIIANWTKKK